MRKISNYLSIILVFITTSIFSQNYTITLTKNGYIKSVTYVPTKAEATPTTTTTVYNNNSPFVGKLFISEPGFERDNTMRSRVFTNLATSLNLLANEQISLVKLLITTNSSSGTGSFNINFVGTTFDGSDPEDFWTECATGTYIDDLPYNSVNQSIIIPNSYIVNNLNNYVNFGLYESGNGKSYLYSVKLQIWTTTVQQINITASNNFIGGTIKVGVDENATNRTSPFPFTPNIGNTVNLEAVEQYNSGYFRLWNDTEAQNNHSNWTRNTEHVTFSKAHSFAASEYDNNKTYFANLRKLCNVTFQNDHAGGSIYIEDILYSSPASGFQIVEVNQIKAKAVDHVSLSIDYDFEYWYPGYSTNKETYFTIYNHETYTAYFDGVPLNSYRNQRFNPKVVGQPIKVYWDQHPDTNVTQYKVYRKPKYGTESCVGTFSRTGDLNYTYCFTDPDYVHTNSSSSYDLYYYDVRAYYSPDGNYSAPDFAPVYAEIGGPERADGAGEERKTEITYEYSVSNYPNPYNPSTTINYSIKDAGNVQIVVYDALGRKVTELVNEVKEPGNYNILFDGSKLSNGVYYYMMKSGDFVQTKKMLLVK